MSTVSAASQLLEPERSRSGSSWKRSKSPLSAILTLSAGNLPSVAKDPRGRARGNRSAVRLTDMPRVKVVRRCRKKSSRNRDRAPAPCTTLAAFRSVGTMHSAGDRPLTCRATSCSGFRLSPSGGSFWRSACVSASASSFARIVAMARPSCGWRRRALLRSPFPRKRNFAARDRTAKRGSPVSLVLSLRDPGRRHGPANRGPILPRLEEISGSVGNAWWAWQDSNLQPDRYERSALTIELQAPGGSRRLRSGCRVGGIRGPCGGAPCGSRQRPHDHDASGRPQGARPLPPIDAAEAYASSAASRPRASCSSWNGFCTIGLTDQGSCSPRAP